MKVSTVAGLAEPGLEELPKATGVGDPGYKWATDFC